MAIPDFRGLSRWGAMQQADFGTSGALRPSAVSGVVGQQYRRQQEDYNTAMRLLRREARRGDVNSALGAIKLREEANMRGIAPGGIRRREEFDAGIRGRADSMAGAVRRMELADELDAASMDLLTRDMGADSAPSVGRRMAGGGRDPWGIEMSAPERRSSTFISPSKRPDPVGMGAPSSARPQMELPNADRERGARYGAVTRTGGNWWER